MKALVLRAPGPIATSPLKFEDVPRPTPGSDQVLVRVAASGVCRTDLHLTEGELPLRRGHVIPGHQIVGIVEERGGSVENPKVGDRVGIAWLHRTCGQCRTCRSGRENLCDAAEFTGWSVDGGFAEYAVAPAEFTYVLPSALGNLEAAPLLCAGIIGFRALRWTGLTSWSGARVGLYGFGAAGHIVLQLARSRGADVYVCTRDEERHQRLAGDLGAVWVGGTFDSPPVPLDAAIVFAPAGEIVPVALSNLDRGGTLVLAGIHMSDIPAMKYSLLYGERQVRSVANNTRVDGREFLEEVARRGIRARVETFGLAAANEALSALKHDAVRGAAVLDVAAGTSAVPGPRDGSGS